jgi:major membrane immunogen (membrane-anchored lipoprotein)
MTDKELKNIIMKEFKKYNTNYDLRLNPIYFKEYADNIISKLPSLKDEQIITEDRIVEVLRKCHNDYFYTRGKIKSQETLYKETAHQIATEILKDKGWESIGEVEINEGNIDNIGYWFKNYMGKYEIAVREVK